MATEQFSNNGLSSLNGAITSGASTLIVNAATSFPTIPQFRLLIDSELMLVTAVSGTTFTITRAIEGTVAAAHANGVAVYQSLTAGAIAGLGPGTRYNGVVPLYAWNCDDGGVGTTVTERVSAKNGTLGGSTSVDYLQGSTRLNPRGQLAVQLLGRTVAGGASSASGFAASSLTVPVGGISTAFTFMLDAGNTGTGVVYALALNANNRIEWDVNTSDQMFVYSSRSSTVLQTTPYSTARGVKHRWLVTYSASGSAGTLIIYCDGREVTRATDANAAVMAGALTAMAFGTQASVTGAITDAAVAGVVGDVVVYGSTLTAAQALADANGEFLL